MASIKDLRNKIRSTKGTLKITSAMKLVSAAKLSKAQQAILNARPYANELDQTIRTVSALATDYSHEYFGKKVEETFGNPEKEKVALLVFSSNKGLCGGFNAHLAKEVLKFVETHDYDIKVYFVGKKVMALTKAEIVNKKLYEFESNEPTYAEIESIAVELSDLYKNNEFSKVFVGFNHFNSAISFVPTISQVLPMSLPEEEKIKIQEEFPFDFKYDIPANQILDVVVPETYISSLFTAYLDAQASEHGARMAAMDNAVKNCKEAIRVLTLNMNKLRQAAITTELTEVVSGAESLNN